MENRLMRKTFLALLISSLAVAQATLVADEILVAAKTNVQPASKPSSQAPAVAPNASPDVQQAAREEVLRREEAQAAARALIDQGQKLYYDGKYEEAVAKLEQAVKILPRAKVTEIDYNRAAHGLTDSYYRLADAAFRAGDNAKAKQLAEKALQYDSSNRSAENIIVKVKQAQREAAEIAKRPPTPPEVPALDKTPEFQTKKDEVKRLFREGKILMNSGQYDEAEKRFKQVLLLDRYNEDAQGYLADLTELRQGASEVASESARRSRLWQITDAWVPPIGAGVEVPKPGPGGGPAGPSVRTAEIMEKLNTIIFPEINFREAVVSDVVKFLSDESRRLDKAGVGVNIVIGGGIEEGGGEVTPAVTPEAGQPAAAVAPAAARIAGSRKISLNLRNVPLIEVLKYVTQLGNLKFRIESSAVLILPPEAPEGQMVTRSYPVSPGAFKTLVTTPTAETKTSGTEEYRALGTGGAVSVSTVDIKKLFEDAGVAFPTGSSLVYNDRTSTIVIRNTPENLETFERVLSTFNVVPSQVEIEAKFVEISQNDLDELGFNWKVGNKDIGSFAVEGGSPNPKTSTLDPTPTANSDTISGGLRESTVIQANAIDALLASQGFGTLANVNNNVATLKGILTNPQFELVVKALSQKKSADVLSAPKVTTISGAQAQIRVVQEFIYPTEYQPPQVVAAGGGSTGGGAVGVTPSIPGTFKTREVGVLLNVTPTVGADGYTINLQLIPEVSEFLGFINYGGPISVAAGNNVITTFNDIKQPLFSSRNLTTSIVIWDGQTVVLGGLIREDVQKLDDKIPFLGDIPIAGRLFRSKTTVRNKRNLLIFVTARLIDPAGNPIHRQPV